MTSQIGGGLARLIESIYKPAGYLSLSSLYFIKYWLKYRRCSEISAARRGFRDHRGQGNENHPEYTRIFGRITEAFLKAKDDQGAVAEPYQVGCLWQSVVDRRCTELADVLCRRDTDRLRILLENFHREEFTRGSGEGSGDYYASKRVPFYKYMFVDTWYRYYAAFKQIAGETDRIDYPRYGNPMGLYQAGSVIPLEAIRFAYYAVEIQSLLRDVRDPVVCEIGSGVGGQAYSALSRSDKNMTYVLFDIPEVLVVASYFLMASLPQKRTLLYGEGTLDGDTLREYDIVLMPNFMLPKLADKSVDLFFNTNSFSEMNRATVEEYVHQVERICRKFFMHVNHNARFTWYEDGEEITNLPADQINPDPERFKRIYQHPRVFARLEDQLFYRHYRAQHNAYLYQRMEHESR